MVTAALRELRVDPKEKRIKWARAVVKESLWVCEGWVAGPRHANFKAMMRCCRLMRSGAK